MPRRRYQKMEVARREALLAAAAAEFAQRGYEAASINQVLESAGFSKSSFYYYFDDKADLAATVLAEAYQAPLKVLRSIQPPTSIDGFWREVHRIERLLLDALEATPQTFQLSTRLGAAVLKEPTLAERLTPLLLESRGLMTGLWAQGQTLGAVRDDLSIDALIAMIQAVKQAAWQTTFPADHVPTVDEVEAFSHHVLDVAQRLAAPKTPAVPLTTATR